MKANQIVVILLLASLSLTALTMPVGEAQEDTREFRFVHLNLKDSDKLSPETNHKNNTEAITKYVPAEYSESPLFPGARTPEWTDAGKWNSDAIKAPMTLRGTVKFNLWYTIRDEGFNGEPDWIFELQKNGDAIATTDIVTSAKSTDEPVEVRASALLSSTIEAVASDTFTVYIQYRNAEDCDLYYDNLTYFSGAAVEMDPVIIFEANGKVSAQFHDAWGLDWNKNEKYFCTVDVAGKLTPGGDDTVVADDADVSGDNSTYSTIRITFANIDAKNGDTITVTIAYGPNNNGTSEGWSYSFTKGGEGDTGDNGDDDEFPIAMVGAGGIGIALIVVLGYLFVYRKRGEEEEEYEEEYEEYEDEEEAEEE